MSIRIPCSHCGVRPVEEFVYGEIPSVPETIEDEIERDIDFGWMRNNPEGVQREAWFHAAGCRRWSYLQRDTASDRVINS